LDWRGSAGAVDARLTTVNLGAGTWRSIFGGFKTPHEFLGKWLSWRIGPLR